MKCYRYDSDTFEYIGEEEAIENTVTNSQTQKWFVPANCTFEIPPRQKEGYVILFDKSLQIWYNEIDNRHTWVVDIETHKKFQYGKLGEIPSTLTTVEPNWEYEKWLKFDFNEQAWTFDTTKRNELLEHLWELRKEIRTLKCESDIDYNGHLVHVDPISFNDIMLAFQNAMFTNDMSTPRRWVCANGDVEFTGQDFMTIMQLYGARRERLVFESNDGWRRDTLKHDEFLLSTLTELNEELAELLALKIS